MEPIVTNLANIALEDGGFQGQDLMSMVSLSNSVKLPELLAAEEFRNSQLLKFKDESGAWTNYPICSTKLRKLGEYGVGLELYFYLIRSLSILFLFISLISIWSMVENYNGEGLDQQESQDSFDRLTIANQSINTFVYSSAAEAEEDNDEIENNLLRVVVADAACTMCFIIFLVIYRLKSKNLVKENLKNNITAADYALCFKGFPKENLSATDVREHFSKFGDVIEVYLARKYNGLLYDYKKRALYSLELGYYHRVAEGGYKNVSKKILKLQKKINAFDEKIMCKEKIGQKTHEELPVERVYVMFNDIYDKKMCLKEYRRSLRCCRRKKNQPEHLKFLGEYPLKAKTATEPNNIYWENLEVTACSRFCRRVLSSFVTILVMAISFSIIYYLRGIENSIPSDEECAQLRVDTELGVETAKTTYLTEDEELCYCKGQSWTDLINDEDINNYCDNYINTITFETTIRVLGSIGVVWTNLLIKFILIRLSKYERHTTQTREETRILKKVLVAMFINTAIIILIVNWDLSELKFLPSVVLNGDYNDFDKRWFIKVGSTITFTLLLTVFSPHLINMFCWSPFHHCKRKCCWKCYKTQHELNMAYNGSEFKLSTRTAMVLNALFSCYMYSGGIPMLNVFCFCTMALVYWADKTLILRYYKKPPLFNHSINDHVISVLPYCIVIHCTFSIFMFGSGHIFPTGFHLDDGVITPDTETLGDRLFRISGIVNILLILLTFFVTFWLVAITKALKSFINKVQTIVHEEFKIRQGNYREEIEHIQSHGLPSYNIFENPVYKALVVSINASAISIQGRVNNSNNRSSDHNKDQIDQAQSYCQEP